MSFAELASFQDRFGAALASDVYVNLHVEDAALARALAVHRNTAAKALQDALAANYPVVRALCGDEAFFAGAAAYARVQPAREPRLNAFGEGFEAFLRDYPPMRDLTYLPDVARLERLFTEALFAADAEPMGAAEAARRLADPAPLRLHPATRAQQFNSPAVSIWRAHQIGEAAALSAIVWSAEAVLVTRPTGAVRVMAADPGLIVFLLACVGGADPLAAAEAANAAGAELSTLLPTLIEAGAFA
jgi:hypothetical protein